MFSREEFRRLLTTVHTILRDNHKMEPGAAFDQASKILFIKLRFERAGSPRRFSLDFIDQYQNITGANDRELVDRLFDETKSAFEDQGLFEEDDRLEISLATFKRIVRELEGFDLSATQDDIKGLAFESFLSQTFRGSLGQFFTPRPGTHFAVEMLAPVEGELMADPAAGTGGFELEWIRSLREMIEVDVAGEKEPHRRRIQSLLDEGVEPEAVEIQEARAAIELLNAELDAGQQDSRLGRAVRSCFGVDAEPRAARTGKMNLMMHGAEAVQQYFFDGLLDVGGLYEGRFDAIATNPPFGSSVGDDQRVGDTTQTNPKLPREVVAAYERQFGPEWRASYDRMVRRALDRVTVLELFDIGRDPIGGPPSSSKVRKRRETEKLFLERCLRLLKPGGRLAIFLPEGILNNPSNQWLRDYVESKARLVAVVSFPQAFFASANATVKTSMVFLRKFTEDEQARFDALKEETHEQATREQAEAREALIGTYQPRIDSYDSDAVREKQREVAELEETSSKARVAEARRELRDLISKDRRDARSKLERELKAALRDANAKVETRARELLREATAQPVFFAEAEHAGITATGATGDSVQNDLPEIFDAFQAWRQEHKPW